MPAQDALHAVDYCVAVMCTEDIVQHSSTYHGWYVHIYIYIPQRTKSQHTGCHGIKIGFQKLGVGECTY